jgi:hypothetical protein
MSNGELKSHRSHHGSTTWVWDAKEPMASYLTTATIGEFDLTAYRKDGIRYWDAIDPDLFTPIVPRTGDGYALSQQADNSYKRLSRTISVPAGGSQLSFWVTRDTELDWDFMFVEAHQVGTDGWTTLPDLNGHTSDNTGNSCPVWPGIHPFLAHYQTVNDDGSCSATGSTGVWRAATGASDGYEQWAVDLSAYAGEDVEVSISYASDDVVQRNGVFVDDVAVSSGPGSTSFEDDGDTLDGWTVPGPPEDSPGNETDWIAGTAADAPTTTGEIAAGSFAREPEIIAFLSSVFGRYPFSAAGGIVDDIQGLEFALENQTRPIYWRGGMTLHALRLKIGDRDFFRLLKQWVRRNAGGNVTTPEFIALAERISGQDLGDFFETWLFTPQKPAGIEPAGARLRSGSRAAVNMRSAMLKARKR